MSETPPVIAMHEVCKVFGGADAMVAAVSGCTVLIRRGDYASISGSSGSGKSTLLNLLGLLDVPTSGEYELDGVPVSALGDAARSAVRASTVGIVFQDSRLLAHRTVLENVGVGLMYGRYPRRQRAGIAREAVHAVGMDHRRDALPATLSGGERQRVAIARAIARRPALLLADEPTGNLDLANTRGVLALFDELHQAGHTVVVVTHDPQVAARSGRRFFMTDGQLVESAETPPLGSFA